MPLLPFLYLVYLLANPLNPAYAWTMAVATYVGISQ